MWTDTRGLVQRSKQCRSSFYSSKTIREARLFLGWWGPQAHKHSIKWLHCDRLSKLSTLFILWEEILIKRKCSLIISLSEPCWLFDPRVSDPGTKTAISMWMILCIIVNIKLSPLLYVFTFDIHQAIFHADGSPLAAEGFRMTCWLNWIQLTI